MKTLPTAAKDLASILLQIEAVKFNAADPFTWASGYRMPIYNDNRLLLGKHQHRLLVLEGFLALTSEHHLEFDVIAGTATAGISPGTTLADRLQKPFIYVRDKSKSHGMKNQIEGVLHAGDKVLVIEDVVSTGESSLRAVSAIRAAGGVVETCFSIFSYDFSHAVSAFQGSGLKFHSILTYDTLLQVARAENFLAESDMGTLREWRTNPFQWGESHGFPKKTLGGN